SEALAAAAGVNSAKLRKDLSHLGSYGTRGVGYDVALLIEQIEHVLGLTHRRAVALVGVGNLGHALAGYAGFGNRGFRIAALFDADPARVGEPISGLTVRHIDEVAEVVAAEQIAIAVIATPAITAIRSEEHTSELQSPYDLVCRLLLEKKKKKIHTHRIHTPTSH